MNYQPIGCVQIDKLNKIITEQIILVNTLRKLNKLHYNECREQIKDQEMFIGLSE